MNPPTEEETKEEEKPPEEQEKEVKEEAAPKVRWEEKLNFYLFISVPYGKI